MIIYGKHVVHAWDVHISEWIWMNKEPKRRIRHVITRKVHYFLPAWTFFQRFWWIKTFEVSCLYYLIVNQWIRTCLDPNTQFSLLIWINLAIWSAITLFALSDNVVSTPQKRHFVGDSLAEQPLIHPNSLNNRKKDLLDHKTSTNCIHEPLHSFRIFK